MILADGTLAIYIAAGLAGFLVLLWCCALCVCKGPCRSLNEPVKSPFEMHMDPASRDTALRNKYEAYHYHLMTPKTPTQQHQVKLPIQLVPTPISQGSGSPIAFDFGAVLKMQAADKANAKTRDSQVRDSLIDKEQGDSSSDSNNENVELKKLNTITVDVQSTDDKKSDKPLLQEENNL